MSDGDAERVDPTVIERLAAAVAGVREAVTVTDRRLRARPGQLGGDAEPQAPMRSTPIPDGRPALSVGPPAHLPAGAPATLVEALTQAARLAPDRGTTYVRLDGGTDRQTYRELLDESRRVLSGLRELGVRGGDSVLLQCADSRSFVTGFWACVLGGYLPTPVGPAPDYHGDNAATRKLRAAWELLDHPVILTDTGLRDRVATLAGSWGRPDALTVASVAELTRPTPAEPVAAHPDDPVLNLLTSGSTGTPKCVRHAHSSIVARTYATAAANDFTEHEVSLNWMPLDHVGGIVMYNVRDVFLRCEHVNAPTEAFIRRPLDWLDWTERFGATNTWAPNFAFALVNKHADEIAGGRWDLSSMRNVCNAGEAVVARTAHRFLELLTPHGLPADAMVPCWGMSETSSGVTYSRLVVPDRSVGTVSLDPGSLGGRLATVDPGTPRAVVLTEVGRPIPGVSLRVVDDAEDQLSEGQVGRLQVAGTTILREYYRNPAANAATFRADGWFDTGDLGFLRDGCLTLTGRLKDMVIVNGANYPVHEVEAVVEQAGGVRPACAAVCGVHDEDTGTDGALVFFVPDEGGAADLGGTVTRIRTALAHDLAMRPKTVVPVTAAEFPRTASGKIQRGQLTDAFSAGRFDGRRHDLADERAEVAGDGLAERVWCRAEPVAVEPDGGAVVLYAPPGTTLPDTFARLAPGAVGVLRAGSAYHVDGPRSVTVDPLDTDQHRRALVHLTDTIGPLRTVTYAWEATPPAEPSDPGAAPARLLAAMAALAATAPEAHLTVVTRGAVGVHETDVVAPDRAALTAMVRTAAAEGTVATSRLVDVAPATADEELARLALARYGDEIVAERAGVLQVPRLRVVDTPVELGMPPELLPPGGTVLVTGGLGGLGRLVTEYLAVGLGARVLVVGRTPAAELADLRDLGDVRYAAVDVADPVALERAVVAAEQAWDRPLDLVVHLAGAAVAAQWADLPAHELRRESRQWLDRMLRPKLHGCASLERLLATRSDTAAVLFSSVNGFLGGSAFGAYSAANAAVDGYAHRWAANGRTVRCVAWSMWAGTGMNDGSPLVSAAERRGLRLIDPSRGLGLLLAALNQPRPYLLAGVDVSNAYLRPHLAPDQFAGGATLVAVAPEDGADPDAVARAVAAAVAAAGELVQVVVLPQIPRGPGGAPDPVAVLAARDHRPSRFVEPDGPTEVAVAQILGRVLELGAVGRDDSFFALGGDSIRGIQVMGGLQERFGHELPVSLLYEHPTVRELAAAVDGDR